MVINVTSIRLKSLWKFFPLTYNAMHIVRQTRTQPGFIRMRNTGFGYDHYTMSVWKDSESLKVFARSGAHLAAMKKSAELADEIRSYSWEGEEIPSWREVRAILGEKGKVFTYK